MIAAQAQARGSGARGSFFCIAVRSLQVEQHSPGRHLFYPRGPDPMGLLPSPPRVRPAASHPARPVAQDTCWTGHRRRHEPSLPRPQAQPTDAQFPAVPNRGKSRLQGRSGRSSAARDGPAQGASCRPPAARSGLTSSPHRRTAAHRCRHRARARSARRRRTVQARTVRHHARSAGFRWRSCRRRHRRERSSDRSPTRRSRARPQRSALPAHRPGCCIANLCCWAGCAGCASITASDCSRRHGSDQTGRPSSTSWS